MKADDDHDVDGTEKKTQSAENYERKNEGEETERKKERKENINGISISTKP